MLSSLKRCLGPGLVLSVVYSLVGCAVLRNPQDGQEWESDGPPTEAQHEIAGPIVGADPTMRGLASDLDHLEKHIDWYGSVTSKVPDVWGQARLTVYREQFETEMLKDLSGFQDSINGSVSRSDQAFFASATALSLAAQPSPPVVGRVTTVKNTPPSLAPTQQTIQQYTLDPTTGTRTLTNTTLGPPSSAPPPTPVKPLDMADPSTLVPGDNFKRNDAMLSRPTIANNVTISLEPSEHLAQKKRYLDFLAQIRRENEGDDTADSPGYSLNLVRMPVSILPGKRTELGFGAEITMTATPILGEDLLPMTFRNLLTNDIQNQLGLPITQLLNEAIVSVGPGSLINADYERFVRVVTLLSDYLSQSPEPAGEYRSMRYAAYLLTPPAKEDFDSFNKLATPEMKCALKDLLESAIDKLKLSTNSGFMLAFTQWSCTVKNCPPTPGSSTGQNLASGTAHPAAPPKGPQENYEALRGAASVRKAIQTQLANFPTRFNVPALSFSNGLDNRTAFPTSQILDVYGPTFTASVAFGASQAFTEVINQQKYAHLPDVQGYLKEETREAYQFLLKNPQLWQNYCTPHLVEAVRSKQWEEVNTIRQHYRYEVALLTRSLAPELEKFDPSRMPLEMSKTPSLGWCLIVDGALLNDRLMRDMKETASAKGQPLAGCLQWCPYFLPEPPAECRQAFNQYVKLRWPLRVFALDPYIQEQNIADSLSTRRELQLALSIAFTNGQMNARQFNRFARRLEGEYETIDLNRTQVGFGHGENVFGWRFYPRYQTPDTDSNFTVFFRDTLIGGPNRNQLLRKRRLEPGMRECVAVVMMPSFVPYATVDTISNWFPITDPKHKVLDNAQALRLSRTVQTIKNEGSSVRDACNYRPGEFERMLRRADQMEARLPTQTLTTPVPILNTLGGFEMFSNGTTDLAPELFGWYGAPGIDPAVDSTTLFLVGDHFSPLRTQVIVGNEQVTPGNLELLSRQVLRVSFAKTQYALSGPLGKEVRIHLATPYGVTRELAVPWVKQTPTTDPGPGFSFAGAKVTVLYGLGPVTGPNGCIDPTRFAPTPAGIGTSADASSQGGSSADSSDQDAASAGPSLKINWVAPAGILAQNLEVSFDFDYPPGALKLPCQGGYQATAKGKTVTIAAAELDRFARDMVTQMAKLTPQLSINPNPLAAGLKSKKVTITIKAVNGIVAQTATTTDQLNVTFMPSNGCPSLPKATTATWSPLSITVPFAYSSDKKEIVSGGKPTPDQLTLTIKNADQTKVDLSKVASVALTLTVATSTAQPKTIHCAATPGKDKDGKEILTLDSATLDKELLTQFKSCLGDCVCFDMPVTSIELLDSASKPISTTPLTLANILMIRWQEVPTPVAPAAPPLAVPRPMSFFQRR